MMVSTRKGRREFLRAAAAGIALGSLPLAVRAADARNKLKIGIVGSGRIGGTLGRVWANAGHTVMFSSLDLDHDKALAAEVGHGARAGTPREAAAFGEVLLVAVPYHALPNVGKDLGALLKGKIVIDACNPFTGRDGEVGVWAQRKGAGLASAELLPGARIVRAFNAISYATMGEAAQRKEGYGMPVASDDAQAFAVASGLVRDIGYEPVLVGGLAFGRHLVPRTPLAGQNTPEEIRAIAATLK